jgi:hypothetical protein
MGLKGKTDRQKKVHLRYTEEEQSKWTASERRLESLRMYNHFNYEYSHKDNKKVVLKWMQHSGEYSKQQISDVSLGPDNMLPTKCGAIARAWEAGWILDANQLKHMKDGLEDYFVRFDSTRILIKQEQKTTTAVPQLTIQDRIKIKVNEHIGYFEELQDELRDKNKLDPKAFEYFKKENVPQNMLKGIAEPFIERLEEWKEAKAGTDEDLKEGYSHWQAKDFKKYFEFVEAILADIDAYAKTKKAVKVARVKKAPNKQKQVAKMNYAKDNTTYKIASVDPVTIIGATELYVFNVKTRKLGKYVADTHMGVLGVKGTTIVGYDTNLSTQKTLRKPERQLPEFMDASKVNKRKFLQGIKSVEIALNGRLNSDTILLHVQ